MFLLAISCGGPTPVDPGIVVPTTNKMNVTLEEVYQKTSGTDTVEASVAGSGYKPYLKISFSRIAATWNQTSQSGPILYKIYRKVGNGKTEVVAWSSENIGSGSIVYQNADQSLDTLPNANRMHVYDPVDASDLNEPLYGVAAVTELDFDPVSAVYSAGSEGEFSFVAYHSSVSRQLVRLTLNNSETYTVSNIVRVSATFDTSGVVIIDYRTGASVGDTGESIVRDTLAKLLRTGFFSNSSVNGNMLSFVRNDTLKNGLGKKWVKLSMYDWIENPIGTALYDDIDIMPYNASVILNSSSSSILQDERQKKYCVLSNSIPVIFNTYGDTTFNDTVLFWVATRKLGSKFYEETPGQIKAPVSTFQGIEWPDCVFETMPELFVIDKGIAYADLCTQFDYKTGYHVSPLAAITQTGTTLNSADFTLNVKLGGIVRHQGMGSLLGSLVNPGSILGYSLSRLDSYVEETIRAGSDSAGYSLGAAITSVGWHYAKSFASIKAAGTLNDYFGLAASDRYHHAVASDFCLDPEGGLYPHDMRGLPITAQVLKAIVEEGTKEFIICAYARGKFFNEPRVFISKFFSDYSYVWDHIPPQFNWSITCDNSRSSLWNPKTDEEYAPLYYKDPVDPNNDKISDLTSLGGSFSVFLSGCGLFTSMPSVRDAGFGKIKSVRLAFNFRSDYLGTNPVTGERTYVSPNKYFDVPEETIRGQSASLYSYVSERVSYSLSRIAFKNIDCSGWAKGVWDMWIETEDNLGNRGIAPYASYGTPYLSNTGKVPVRQLEIK